MCECENVSGRGIGEREQSTNEDAAEFSKIALSESGCSKPAYKFDRDLAHERGAVNEDKVETNPFAALQDGNK